MKATTNQPAHSVLLDVAEHEGTRFSGYGPTVLEDPPSGGHRHIASIVLAAVLIGAAVLVVSQGASRQSSITETSAGSPGSNEVHERAEQRANEGAALGGQRDHGNGNRLDHRTRQALVVNLGQSPATDGGPGPTSSTVTTASTETTGTVEPTADPAGTATESTETTTAATSVTALFVRSTSTNRPSTSTTRPSTSTPVVTTRPTTTGSSTATSSQRTTTTTRSTTTATRPTTSSERPPTSSTSTISTTSTHPITSTTTTSTTGGSSVVWEEHFNSLDTARWKPEHSTYGDGNNELQCYQPSNVSVSSGRLVLTARSAPVICPRDRYRTVSSGMVRSQGLTFSPGQAIEFRAKLTPNDANDQGGLWPAVWASSWAGSWPFGGELDWLEVMTAEDPRRSVFSMHYADRSGGHELQNKAVPMGSYFSDSWHTIRFDYGYGGRLTWYLDGQQVFSVNAAETSQGYPAPFNQTIEEIKINLAIGGSPGPLAPGALGASGATFEIDYIKVFNL